MNQQIEEIAKIIYDNTTLSYLRCVGIAQILYQNDYRKKGAVVEEYRQKANTKMGKHTHLLGKEYVQRILREVAKEMKGGAE